MALAVGRVLSAPRAFCPSLPARAFSAADLPQTILAALLRQNPFFRVHGTMGAKRRWRSQMQFAPSHGRSLRPHGVGAERSNYSCRPSFVVHLLTPTVYAK